MGFLKIKMNGFFLRMESESTEGGNICQEKKRKVQIIEQNDVALTWRLGTKAKARRRQEPELRDSHGTCWHRT